MGEWQLMSHCGINSLMANTVDPESASPKYVKICTQTEANNYNNSHFPRQEME